MTKDELFEAYAEIIAKIDKAAHEAREKARLSLRKQLKSYRNAAHAELKAIRAMEQKTKRSKKNAG